MSSNGNGTSVAAYGQATPLPEATALRVVVISASEERACQRAKLLDALGYAAPACSESQATPSYLAENAPDAIVVDGGREPGNLVETIARIRTASPVPVLVIGASGTLAEMERCYNAGADEYCIPRAHIEEIDLRLRALLRREDLRSSEHERVLRVGDLEIDRGAHTVRKSGTAIPLSPTEFRLLATLAERPGEIIPTRALIARVWGTEYADETHYLRLYVRYLRQKIEDDPSDPHYIVNRWGTGYALTEPSKAA